MSFFYPLEARTFRGLSFFHTGHKIPASFLSLVHKGPLWRLFSWHSSMH